MKENKSAVTLPPCTKPDLGAVYADYLLGRVQMEKASEIEHHLPDCPSCRQEMDLWLYMIENGVSGAKNAPRPH